MEYEECNKEVRRMQLDDSESSRCWETGRADGVLCLFFFQAEDGIRDYKVTGVQTCALPISCDGSLSPRARQLLRGARGPAATLPGAKHAGADPPRSPSRPCPALQGARGRLEQIGRASCRERV